MKPNVNVMCDIETFGLQDNAVILQIAMITFDDEFKPLDRFEITISVAEQILSGRTIDADTVSFWEKQEKSIQDHVFAGERTPEIAAKSIIMFLSNIQRDYTNVHFWTNGLLTDVVFINNFLRMYSNKTLNNFIKYNHFHDFRTLRNAAKSIDHEKLYKYEDEIEKSYVHEAVSDCLWQIESLKAVTKILNCK